MSNVPRRDNDRKSFNFSNAKENKEKRDVVENYLKSRGMTGEDAKFTRGEDNRFSGGSFGPTQISGKGRSGTDSKDRM
jgi:hypothetical protein